MTYNVSSGTLNPYYILYYTWLNSCLSLDVWCFANRVLWRWLWSSWHQWLKVIGWRSITTNCAFVSRTFSRSESCFLHCILTSSWSYYHKYQISLMMSLCYWDTFLSFLSLVDNLCASDKKRVIVFWVETWFIWSVHVIVQ